MEEFRSPVLIAPCKSPLMGGVVSNSIIQAKSLGMKRRLSGPSDTGGSLSIGKKVCRQVKCAHRLSKVKWDLPAQHREDHLPLLPKKRCSVENETDTWHSKEEYKKLLLDQFLTVHIMRSLRALSQNEDEKSGDSNNDKKFSCDDYLKKLAIDPKDYCERGLENYESEEGRNQINLNRKRHKLLVIEEYKRQRITGTNDPELVRIISMTQSVRSMLKAQLLAAIDQQEARANNNGAKDETNGNNGKKKYVPKQHLLCPCVSLMSHLDSNGTKPTNSASVINEENIVAQLLVHRNDGHYVPQAVRDEFSKQHKQLQYRDLLLQQHRNFLLKQQQQLQHHIHSESKLHQHLQHCDKTCYNDKIMNIQQNTSLSPIAISLILNSMQGQELLRCNQQQQQHHHHLCYQKHIQHLLHRHHHQQQLRVIGLASAGSVENSPR